MVPQKKNPESRFCAVSFVKKTSRKKKMRAREKGTAAVHQKLADERRSPKIRTPKREAVGGKSSNRREKRASYTAKKEREHADKGGQKEAKPGGGSRTSIEACQAGKGGGERQSKGAYTKYLSPKGS